MKTAEKTTQLVQIKNITTSAKTLMGGLLQGEIRG
jgi:hypothetical protein